MRWLGSSEMSGHEWRASDAVDRFDVATGRLDTHVVGDDRRLGLPRGSLGRLGSGARIPCRSFLDQLLRLKTGFVAL